MRIAYLIPHDTYLTRMDLGRVLYSEALGELDNVELVLGGKGWPDYSGEQTVTENLGNLDAVIVYKGGGILGLEEVPVRAITFNESHEETHFLKEIEDAHANLIVFHHEGDMEYRKDVDCKKVNILHCTKTFLNEEKTKDCIVAGVLSPEIYPLRSRLADLIKSGRLSGKVRHHPGYRLKSKEICLHQYNDYNKDVSSARISLTCTSIYKYPLSKIIESMALGTLVVCDMPDGEHFKETIGKHIVEISNEMSDDEICGVVQRELDNPEELQRKSLEAQEFARNYTMEKYAERLLSEIKGVYEKVSS